MHKILNFSKNISIMFITKLIICLLALKSSEARRDCKQCISIYSCSILMRQNLTKGDKAIKNKLKVYFCGSEMINKMWVPQVCCSDYIYDISHDKIKMHKNIGLLPKSCGKINKDNNDSITSSGYANLYDFPWIVLISSMTRLKNGGQIIKFQCAGSIINSKYILTSAHCIKDQNIAKIRIGEYDLNSRIDCQEEEQPFKVCEDHLQDINKIKIIVHPHYTAYPIIKNDIALIRLMDPIDFSYENAAPICLPVSKSLKNLNLSTKDAIIAGWEIIDTNNGSSILRWIDLPILTNALCREYYDRYTKTKGKQNVYNKLCAGEVGKDNCRGNYGGPLVLKQNYHDDTRMVQYGIVSYGPKRCGRSYPGVYTDVTKYITWILDNIKA